MTLWHFLESIVPWGHKKGWLLWKNGLPRPLQCPACHTNANMATRRSIASPFKKHRRFALYDCPKCGSGHFPDISAPPYEDKHLDGQKDGFLAAKKFYVEQGAGFDSMFAPFFWAQKNKIKSLLEVGCGYGFSLDFAAKALKWNVTGIDPSHIARAGTEELGISIVDGYLDRDTKVPGLPFDLVYSSEVIEHIGDPDPFIYTLAHAAGEDGTILLTTPDIAGLRAERQTEEIIPLLSPGSHLVLYSEAGLEACLRRAGLAHVKTHSTGDTLYAFASNATIKVDFKSPVDPKKLSQYLETQMKGKDLPPHLITGFSGRLLRTQTDTGDYAKAQRTFDTLHTHLQKTYHIDIKQPDTEKITAPGNLNFAAYAKNHPFNLVTILYCGGILSLNHHQNHDLALAYFTACDRAYRTMEPVLTAANTADLDSRHLAINAAMLRASLTAQKDPLCAVDVLLLTRTFAGQFTNEQNINTLLEVFAGAANAGHYAAAQKLRAPVELALENTSCENLFERAAGLGLAMLALNRDFDRTNGLKWLQFALESAPEGKQWEAMGGVWATHAAARGVELLCIGGQKAFTKQRDTIAPALKAAPLSPKDYAVIEALGLAFLDDNPKEALFWFEQALKFAGPEQKAVTAARVNEAKLRVFINAVNAGESEYAANTREAVVQIAAASNDSGLGFALAMDDLNRRADLQAAAERFSALARQNANPDLAIQSAFHLALVLAKNGEVTQARKTATALYAADNPDAERIAELVGNRAAELDAAIAGAA